MNDAFRVDGLEMLVSGMFDRTAEGNADGGAINIGVELGAVPSKLPTPGPKSEFSWMLEA